MTEKTLTSSEGSTATETRHTKQKMQSSTSAVLKVEVVGFCFLIALSWLNELTNFQRFFFSQSQTNWHEAVIETVAVILVAVPTLLMTKRIVDRLHSIEGFLRVCAWCRRLDSDGEWVPMEKYFQQQFSQRATHGICPECYDNQVKTLTLPESNE